MLRIRRTGAILYLVMLALVAFVIGDTFSQAMTVIAVLGWITVAVMAVYMVLFRNMKFTLFKEQPAEPVETFQVDVGQPVPAEVERRADGSMLVTDRN
jgi:hypothetical protein